MTKDCKNVCARNNFIKNKMEHVLTALTKVSTKMENVFAFLTTT